MGRELAQNTQQEIGQGLHIHAGLVLQTIFVDAREDVSTTSQTWTDLFSFRMQRKSAESFLRVAFSASANNANQNTQIRFGLFIDGVLHRGCGCRGQGTFAQAASMIHIISSGEVGDSVDVALKWMVSSGTGQIRPITHSDDESASIIVDEVYGT